MPNSVRTPLTPPKQSRSRRTLERIVNASLEILDAEGARGLTVQAVVKRAGSSVGSFYARFGGKDDLLDYLGERVWDDALDRWNAAISSKTWSDMDLAQITEGAAGVLIDVERSRSVSLKALDRVATGRDASGTFRRHVLDGLSALLLERGQEIEHESPELAVRLGLNAIAGAIDASWGEAGQAVPRETLIQECSELLLGYLTGSAARRSEGGQVDFFEVWG